MQHPCTILSCREKGRNKPDGAGAGAAEQPRACVPLPGGEMVPIPLPPCQRLCPNLTGQQLQPAGHRGAGEMEIFPGRERRQEPIDLSVSRLSQWFFTLQKYLVPLATFPKKITFASSVVAGGVSARSFGARCRQHCSLCSALQCCWNTLECPGPGLPAGKGEGSPDVTSVRHAVTALTALRQAENCRAGEIPSHWSVAGLIKAVTTWKEGTVSSCGRGWLVGRRGAEKDGHAEAAVARNRAQTQEPQQETSRLSTDSTLS